MAKLTYKFKKESLLELALTQSGADSKHNNERLEFLGDRVLGLAVAKMLYSMFPNETEGELARRYAVLVSTDTLSKVARLFELDKKVHHGHLTGGRARHVLANAMEAVLGAIILDSGFRAAQTLILSVWRPLATADTVAPKDSKTKLQEFVQKADSGALPQYEYSQPTGAAHQPVFCVRVSAMGKSAEGKGPSKKAASTEAAGALLKMLAV